MGRQVLFQCRLEKEFHKIKEPGHSFDSSITVGNSTYRVVPNPDYTQNVTGKNYYVIFNSVAGAAGSIAGGLNGKCNSNASTVLELKIETPAPEKGIDVLNNCLKYITNEAIDDKNQIAARTLRFIEDRLDLVVGQLDSVEKNIESYKTRQGVYDLGNQASFYLENVRDLDKRGSEVEIQLDVLKELRIISIVRRKNRVPFLPSY
jgi:hypothetical protein